MKSHKQGHIPLIRKRWFTYYSKGLGLCFRLQFIFNPVVEKLGRGPALCPLKDKSQRPPWPLSTRTHFRSFLCRVCGDLEQPKWTRDFVLWRGERGAVTVYTNADVQVNFMRCVHCARPIPSTTTVSFLQLILHWGAMEMGKIVHTEGVGEQRNPHWHLDMQYLRIRNKKCLGVE